MFIQVIRALRCESSKVPQDYEAGFKKAEYTFLYQLVFDPRSQKQVRLNEIPDGIDPREFEFAGVYPKIILCCFIVCLFVCFACLFVCLLVCP